MGRRSTTGGIAPLGDRIQVRFTWRGKELRPTLDLKPTAANLKHAKRLREQILAEIRTNTFSLARHFPDYKNATALSDTPNARTFADWCTTWAALSVRTLEDSTLRIYKRHLDAYWVAPFGPLMPRSITNEMVLTHLAVLATERMDDQGKTHKALSRKTQNNILIPLRGVFEMICAADATVADPTDKIKNLRVQRGKPDPFTEEEVQVILATLTKQVGAVWADYFEFSFFAGLRASEQIALLWQDVDLRSGTIKVRRARVLAKDKERTKTNVERDVELNARALAVIQRQRARTQAAGDHVFRNPVTGRPWNDEQEQRREWTIALRSAKVRYRPPKECRDTSVTLALMAGADPIWVANQHGHSLIVMMRDYAGWIPRADRGRNLDAVNRSFNNSAVDSAVDSKKTGFSF